MNSVNPPQVMVIDDDRAVLAMVTMALKECRLVVHPFSDAEKALRELEALGTDLVLSDINMDDVDGFEVIRRVKAVDPRIPVMLMTGQASLEYAMQAMRLGAANLFQKPLALQDLLRQVLYLVETHREFKGVEARLKGLVREFRHFRFRSDRMDIPSTVAHLTDRLVPMGFASTNNVDVIAMAYHEALVNALEHGNLEMDSSLKGDLLGEEDAYSSLRAERLADSRYGQRAIDVFLELSPDRCQVVIRDEGPGFDVRNLARLSDDIVADPSGRGLRLIRLVMDEVTYNAQGNEIRMVLWKK
ncbi:MAG: response regulator [Firmicutes bacterium]|nr:response regulator [Bacillota bacterium]